MKNQQEPEVTRLWDIEAWVSMRLQLGITVRELHRLLNRHICDNKIPYDLPTHVTLNNSMEAGKGPKPELQKLIETVLHVSIDRCWIHFIAK
jgi:hypothetical protein